MTTITKNEKTGRVIIEEDGIYARNGLLLQGAMVIKVSVSAEDYAKLERRFDVDLWVGDPALIAALKACESYHVIRKERRID